MESKDENNLEYNEKGKIYAETFYRMMNKMDKKGGGMLKMLLGVDEIPNKIQGADFKIFITKAKMNAHNLCVRDLNEKSRKNPEKDLESFLFGFEKKIIELLES